MAGEVYIKSVLDDRLQPWNRARMIDVFHISGLYLFSAASIADAQTKCIEQGLVNIAHSMRNGVLTVYVKEL